MTNVYDSPATTHPVAALVDQNVIYMEPQNQLQQSNLSEPDALCNFSTNNASTDLNHKPETESEIHRTVTDKTVNQDSRKWRQRSISVRGQSLTGCLTLRKSWWSAIGVSGDAKQLDSGTGKTCFVKDVIDPTFKLHYRDR